MRTELEISQRKRTTTSMLGASQFRKQALLPVLVLLLAGGVAPATAAERGGDTKGKAAKVAPAREDTVTEPASIGPALNLTVGKSTLLRLPGPIERISVGNPAVADVTLVSSRELYLLGKTFGATNVILWHKGGKVVILDVAVGIDSVALVDRLRELLPEEKGVRIHTAADSIVLKGTVSSAMKAEQVVTVAEAYVRAASAHVQAGDATGTGKGGASGGQGQGGQTSVQARVVNMMQIAQPQQVMLEVKVAEVSKTLLDELGVGISGSRSSGNWTYGILSNLLSGGAGRLSAIRLAGTNITIDAEKKDGLIKVLAEPNIVAISGQEASFLAGGKIFIPVARKNETSGGTTITLEEKEFGVGLKFTPTVLDGGRINLKVAPEVSELNQSGSPFATIGGETAILPSFTTRRAQTTVQLMDGQSLAIAGLIKNNLSETVRRLPLLGEIPIIGALFRSSEFSADRSELVFLITPTLVKPLAGAAMLPTDTLVPPSRSEFFLDGKLEGSGHQDVPSDRPPTAPATPAAGAAPTRGGFEVK